MAGPTNNAEAQAKVWQMIKDIHIAMMTTIDDGTLRSRPMVSKPDRFDGTLWFFTWASSHKIDEVERNQQVNLSYALPDKQQYVSVSGTATLVRDKAKAKELWNPFVAAWFPKGLDDPDLALLRVDVEYAEYWDAPSSRMVRLYEYAKANAAGRTPDMGENRKVGF